MFVTIVFFICLYIFTAILINSYKVAKLKELEIQFIVASIYFEQLRYQMKQILEIVYNEAGENDPSYKDDCDAIQAKLDEKFNQLGDVWIKNLEKTVGYKLKYDNWRDLIKKADLLIKDFKRYESRKRN